jgi:hypothetical protein
MENSFAITSSRITTQSNECEKNKKRSLQMNHPVLSHFQHRQSIHPLIPRMIPPLTGL